MEQVVLRVPGMTCGHCQMAVETALKKYSAVREVQVDLEAKTVQVAYEPGKISLEDLEKAVSEIGFEIAK